MRAERRRKQQLRKELEEAGEGPGTGGGSGDRGGGDGAARGGARGSGGGKNMEKTADDQKGVSAAAAGGTSGTSISAPKLAEKSTNANTVDADKGKRSDAGRSVDGDVNGKPEAKKKKKKVVQEEEDDEEEEDEEPAATPYDVRIVVQCKEAKSRQTLTLPSDSTIGFVKRDYIKARGHALSLELFDSLVFFYNGYPVTDGLVIGVISTPGVNLELHIRFRDAPIIVSANCFVLSNCFLSSCTQPLEVSTTAYNESQNNHLLRITVESLSSELTKHNSFIQ